jgi:GTP cyclohydrolase IA
MEVVEPVGVGVVVDAQHLCMVMREVEKVGAVTTTSVMLGEFQTDPFVRQEFTDAIARRSSIG